MTDNPAPRTAKTAASLVDEVGRPGEDSVRVPSSLLDAVKDLRRDVEGTYFPLDTDGVAAARTSRRRLLDQLDDHLLPRLSKLSAPAVVVVAGSTGAGKSTLVNTVLGTEVSAAGVLRPTTRRPVLAHHPDDAALLASHPVLDAVDVVAHDAVPRGLALLDAPDLDSVLETNREMAHRLLEAADLWLFVTTASRYGDALPWRVLAEAMERGASIAMVLNRVPLEALATVRGDLIERLRSRGMQGVPLFVVADAGPHEGLLDPGAVAPITRWLSMLAGPDRARSVIARTLRGSLGALRPWVDSLAEAVQTQADAAAGLRGEIAVALEGPAASARVGILSGAIANGPVRARWAGLSATGGVLAGVVSGRGRIRGSRRAGRARGEALRSLVADLERSTETMLVSAGERAESGLRAHLTGAGSAGQSLVAHWLETPPSGGPPAATVHAQARRVDAVESAADLVLSCDQAVLAVTQSADRAVARRATRASDALSRRGLAAVALAAGAGLEPARELLGALLGPAAQQVVARVTDQLVERVDAVTEAEGRAFTGLLDLPVLADDAAATLRLRLAVLKALT